MKRRFLLIVTAIMLMMTNFAWGQTRTEVTDILTRDLTGVTGTSYASWEGVTSNSNAVYAGQSAGGNESIQLRSNNNNSGIITTASGGDVASISVIWNENTANGRTLNIYGSSAPYSSPTELYNADTQGTLLGTIVNGTSTELIIDGSYSYIGMRSASGAMYLTEIDITWTEGGGTPTVAMPTFSPTPGIYSDDLDVTIACNTAGATIYYTLDGSVPTTSSTVYSSPIGISETTTVKAIGVKAGMNNSAVATATYTIQEMTSITSIDELWDYAEEVGTTATPASVTFDDWYVTGVKNNQVWVSDGLYGFVIYQSGHGFAAGDMLNGTHVCNVLMYQNHYAELTGVTASNLEVTHNQEIPLLEITISELDTRNYGTAIDLGTLSYDGTVFEDADGATIALYNQFNLSPNPIESLEAGKQYNVKGVSIIYFPSGSNPIQQIAPRSADDFEEVVNPNMTATPTFTPAAGTYYEAQNVTISCATNGATIYYTLDGSDPTSESNVYIEAIHIDSDATIKAIAMMEGYDNSDIASASYVIITDIEVLVNQDWEGEMNGWTFVTIEGNKPWTIGQYNGNHYANANGYNDDVDNEQWCISPGFALGFDDNYDVTLTFMNATKFDGPALELYISTDYNDDDQDPTAATWEPLEYTASEGNYTWTESGEIILDDYIGHYCHIGFRYISTIEEGAAAWEIDDILITTRHFQNVITPETTLNVDVWDDNNELVIENNGNDMLNVVVYNLVGQPVLSETVASGNNVIRHDLAEGVYIVRIANGKEATGIKVVVRR